MSVEIRQFQESDAEKLSRMINEVIEQLERQTPEVDFQPVRVENTPEELIKVSKMGPLWVAQESGSIVGTISLHGNRLRRFFVHPDYQGQGIGKGLMNEVKDYLKNNDIKEIWVGALVAAKPIYEKLGFKGSEIFFNKEINQEEVRMKFSLS